MKAIVTSVTGNKYIGDVELGVELSEGEVHQHLADDYPETLLVKNARHLFERFMQTQQGDLAKNIVLMPIDINNGPLSNIVVKVAEIYIPDKKMLDTVNSLIKGAEQSELASQAMKSGLHIPNMKATPVQ